MAWGLAAAVALLVAVPPAAVRYPPVLDLAQQFAQLELFTEAWGDPASPYRIQWTSPNKLSYLVLALARLLGGSEWGPRLALVLTGALVATALFLLARRLGRPPEHAAIATVTLYSSAYYGGFLSFVAGGAAFALWLALLGESDPPAGRRDALRWLGAALLLYAGHLLWLLAAGAVALLPGPRHGGLRRRVLALAALAPFGLAAALWYFGAAEAGRSGRIRYDDLPWERLLDPTNWSTLAFCGLRGPWEPILLAALALWAALAWRRRSPHGPGADGWLARVALVLGLFVVLAPSAIGDTVLLDRRWGPWALACALLALPASSLRPALRAALAATLVLAQAAVTTATWRAFEREEMRGFAASLAAVPDGSRLLGLDFERVSPRFWIGPFFHLAAYAELDHEVTLGASFASHPSSLVVFREPGWPFPWTRGLEHQPRNLAPADLDHFDHLLVHARPEMQARLAALTPRLRRVAGDPPWQLFAVEAAAATGARGGEPIIARP